jgi:TonB family protein
MTTYRWLGVASAALLFPLLALSDDQPSFQLPAHHMLQGAPPAGMYPMQAARLQKQGRVLVQFDISSEGRATGVAVIASEPSGVFDRSALSIVNAWKFDLPSDWAGSDASKHHYTFSVIYHLGPCPYANSCDGIGAFPADAAMVVTLQLGRPPSQ